jgi:chromosome segregation ATPase
MDYTQQNAIAMSAYIDVPTEVEALREKVKEAKSNMGELLDIVYELQKEIEVAKRMNDQHDRTSVGLKKAISEHEKERWSLKKAIDDHKRTIDTLRAEHANELDVKTRRVDRLESDLQSISETNENLKAELEKRDRTVRVLQRKMRTSERQHASSLADLQAVVNKHVEDIHTWASAADAYKQHYEHAQKELAEATSQVAMLKDEPDRLHAEISTMTAELTRLRLSPEELGVDELFAKATQYKKVADEAIPHSAPTSPLLLPEHARDSYRVRCNNLREKLELAVDDTYHATNSLRNTRTVCKKYSKWLIALYSYLSEVIHAGWKRDGDFTWLSTAEQATYYITCLM